MGRSSGVEVLRCSVAVGVDGSRESLAAARYAVGAAAARGMDLLLVHAFDFPPANTAIDEALLESWRNRANELVINTATQLAVPPHMRIDSLVEAGAPEDLLQRVTSRVSLLILGQDHLHWGERLLFGKVASRLGESADCPVVVVPAFWRPAELDARDHVIIAVRDAASATRTLDAAFDEAGRLRTPLLVIHAAPRDSSDDDLETMRRELAELVAGWKEEFPAVEVHTDVVAEQPNAALLMSSRSAELLVLGRRERPWSGRSHPLLRDVAEAARCPVMIVPANGLRHL